MPGFVSRIVDKVEDVQCGNTHTLVLTTEGEVYAMGDNSRG